MIMTQVEGAKTQGHGVQKSYRNVGDKIVGGVEELDQWRVGGVAILGGQEVSQHIVAQVEEHWRVGVKGAVVEHRQGEVVERVVLQLQFLQVGQPGEGAVVDVADLVVREN